MTGAELGAIVIAALLALLVWNTRRPPAVEVSVHGQQLTVRMRGWDVVFCCRRQVVVPLSALADVAVARREDVPAEGLRVPGTSIRGIIRAGSYGSRDRRDFWDVRQGSQFLVIETRPGTHEYRRIVLEMPDAHDEMLRLRTVLATSGVTG